ncbi:hypothetical protein Q5M85_11245 [Paraclostridium bifermentans]|nr:hypothetical protein [Paraclostridium bifermentans]
MYKHFIIALSTNLIMNLLDLRPGRAIKVYLVIIITLLITLVGYPQRFSSYIITSKIVIVYFFDDLKAKAMMGDAGSNVLGISIGILIAIGYARPIRIGWLVFLVFIHALTEKYSLTK